MIRLLGIRLGIMLEGVHNCDVMKILRDLPDSSVDMVYGDPDYNVGRDYHGRKFTMKWDQYIEWYIELSRECMRVLKPHGNYLTINYPKQNSYLRVKYLDRYEVHEYVWVYNTMVGVSPRRFTTAHRSILHAMKSKGNQWFNSEVCQPYKNLNDKRIQQRIRDGHKGAPRYSWLEYQMVKNTSKEKVDHSCQIPIPLFDTLLRAGTKEEDLVFILFAGSGNECIHALKENRRFISCEIHDEYYEKAQDRIGRV